MPSPSIVPGSDDQDIYLVLSNFGPLGRAWCESDEDDTNQQTVLRHLVQGQYDDPVRIIAFNTAQNWSRDVSQEMADAVRRRLADMGEEAPQALEQFLGKYADRTGGLQLPLPNLN